MLRHDDDEPSRGDGRSGHVRSVARAISILDCFLKSSAPLGVSEISRMTGLGKSTIFNLAATLVDAGMLVIDPVTRQYQLGPKVAHLGSSFLEGIEVRTMARPMLQRLQELTGETVGLHIRVGHKRVCIDQVISQHSIRRVMEIGADGPPLWCGSAGIVLMSGLSDEELDAYLASVDIRPLTPFTLVDRREIRRQVMRVRTEGYCMNDQGTEVSAFGVSTPVRDQGGRVVAAIAVSGPTSRWREEVVESHLPDLIEAGGWVSTRMGYRGTPGGVGS